MSGDSAFRLRFWSGPPLLVVACGPDIVRSPWSGYRRVCPAIVRSGALQGLSLSWHCRVVAFDLPWVLASGRLAVVGLGFWSPWHCMVSASGPAWVSAYGVPGSLVPVHCPLYAVFAAEALYCLRFWSGPEGSSACGPLARARRVLGPQSLAARIRIHALGLGFGFVPRDLIFWSGPRSPLSGYRWVCPAIVGSGQGVSTCHGSSLLTWHGFRRLVRNRIPLGLTRSRFCHQHHILVIPIT